MALILLVMRRSSVRFR